MAPWFPMLSCSTVPASAYVMVSLPRCGCRGGPTRQSAGTALRKSSKRRNGGKPEAKRATQMPGRAFQRWFGLDERFHRWKDFPGKAPWRVCGDSHNGVQSSPKLLTRPGQTDCKARPRARSALPRRREYRVRWRKLQPRTRHGRQGSRSAATTPAE